MRRIKLFIATSLDGYIARADGGIDWLFIDGDYGYRAFYDSIDTVVMGRKTWELSLGFDEYPYPGVPAVVFSRTLAGTHDARAEFVAGPVGPFMRRLHSSRDATCGWSAAASWCARSSTRI
jgi:dihydrofolate reductase